MRTIAHSDLKSSAKVALHVSLRWQRMQPVEAASASADPLQVLLHPYAPTMFHPFLASL